MLPQEKKLVKAQIVETIHRICTGDSDTCNFGFCMFNKECAKPYYEIEKLPNKKQKLKSLLKNVKSKERKKLGIKPPTILDHASLILGQDIMEHELIKGHQKSINRLKICRTIKEVVIVFNDRQMEVHGKKKSLPGQGFFYYRKFMWENAIKQ